MFSTSTILHGDCRAMCRTLPDKHVHAAITSPPYWGLRDYGTPHQVWGGSPDCQHEWSDNLRAPWANELPGPNGRHLNTERSRKRTKNAGAFCSRCGAWRGEL